MVFVVLGLTKTFVVGIDEQVGESTEFGVNVYDEIPIVDVEIEDGFQVPEIPLIDVVGRGIGFEF